ncbi:MAG TPA: PAS-domain containing protein [Rhizomicrobium sp.]|jgi:signal transduction histidine kinase|nr:PAS-domain containing protein [Rhizomicrobium sp.]
MAGAVRAHISREQEQNDPSALLDALDSLRTAITIFDARGRLIYANAHLNYLFRSFPPRESLIGKNYDELVRLEIEGGEIAPGALAGGTKSFVAQRVRQLKEDEHAPRDVALRDHRVVEIKARRDKSGHTILLWTDVTNARAQLMRLQEAVALSAEAFAFYDADDRLILANDLYADLCGLKTLDELIGRTFPEICATVAYSGRMVLDESPEVWLERRLEKHRAPAGAVTLRTNTGEAYLVRDRAAPDGGRIMVFTNVTDKVRAETALKEQEHALADSRAQAEKQSSYLADLTSRLDQASASVHSAKTTLLRTMGHELKTPLNAILGFSDLMAALADNLNPGQIREYAGLVHQGGANLLKIINQIMDLTKISAGRYDLRRMPVDAGAVLWLARDVFLSRAAARGITIDADNCPVGLMADADEAVFTAMVHSLMDNAITFSTGKCITLSAIATEGGVAVTVEDDGGGVAAEDLARILEPFEHAGRGEGSEHAKGAGLGLTVVKAFAELHGGWLELESELGERFRATVTLPAAVPSAAS